MIFNLFIKIIILFLKWKQKKILPIILSVCYVLVLLKKDKVGYHIKNGSLISFPSRIPSPRYSLSPPTYQPLKFQVITKWIPKLKCQAKGWSLMHYASYIIQNPLWDKTPKESSRIWVQSVSKLFNTKCQGHISKCPNVPFFLL